MRSVLFALAGLAGGGFFAAKGLIRATDGADLSFVPASLFLLGFGLIALGDVVVRTHPAAWVVVMGRVVASACVLAGGVALSYVLTGTIPETEDAPALVGISYGVGAGTAYLGQLVLGVTGACRRALPGPTVACPGHSLRPA